MADNDGLMLRLSADIVKLEKALSRAQSLGVNYATAIEKRANQSHAKMTASATQSAEAIGREMDRLRSKYDPVYAASKRYETALDELNRAQKVGAIDARVHAQALDRLNAEYAQGANVMEAANVRLAQSSGRMGSQIQNASYQVGDFAVQIASGGSAVTALSQQLPQLLGGFGILGAGLGALVAIGGAAYKVLGDTADEAENAEGSVEAFTGALAALSNYSEIVEMDIDSLRQKFGDFADDVKENARYLAEVAVAKAVDSFATGDNAALVAGLKEVNALYAEMQERRKDYDRTVTQQEGGFASSEQVLMAGEAMLQVSDQAEDAALKIGLTVEQARALGAAFDEVDPAGGMEGVRDAAQGVLDTISQFYPEGAKLPASLVPAVEAMEQIAAKAAQGVETVREMDSAVVSISDNWLASVNAAITAGETAQTMLSTLEAQADMQRLIAEYGEDSVEVAQARADAEREAQEAIVDALAVSDEMRAALMAAWDAANGIASAEMAGGIGAAADEAARLAANLARAIAMAPITSAMRDEDAAMGQAVEPDASDRAVQRRALENFDRLTAVPATRGARPARRTGGGGGAGRRSGGGGGKSEAQRQMEEYEREAKRIYDQTRTAAEAYAIEMERVDRLHRSGALDLETYTRAMDKMASELQEAEFERVQRSIDGISDSIAGAIANGENLGDAFRSTVQGMASDLISSGIRSLIGGLFNSSGGGGGILGSLFGGRYANGAAFSGGRVVPFAKGGIFSGPTMFPMSNGRSGLMGEAGPEAIMPLTRGANGKLGVQATDGGGGTTSVHVTVGVSADSNGNLMPFVQNVAQSTVKAGIAKYDRAMPGKVNKIRATTHDREY